jgi:hypothetical protein
MAVIMTASISRPTPVLCRAELREDPLIRRIELVGRRAGPSLQIARPSIPRP